MKRQRLGQHYLTDPSVVAAMVRSAEVRRGERIMEIGTGKGVLTRALAGLGGHVEAFEIDEENYQLTLESVEGLGVEMHLGDAFDASPRFDVLVSSLPYSESAGFVDWLAVSGFRRAVVLLQADFVEKLLAPPGSRDYRGVSAVSQISSVVSVVRKVPRSSFAPPPRVGSVVALVRPRRRMTRAEVEKVKLFFSLRRRTVGSAAKEFGIVTSGGEFSGRRVYTLTPGEVRALLFGGGG